MITATTAFNFFRAHRFECIRACRSAGFLTLLLLASSSKANDEALGANNHDFDSTLQAIVDQTGRIAPPPGFSGTIDPSGFRMLQARDGEPRFIPVGSGNASWSEGEFEIPGCDGGVNAVAVINEEVYFAGTFDTCGFEQASNIVRFNPVTEQFSRLGEGVNGTVTSLAVIDSILYVGGYFTMAGGLGAGYIARYDPTQTGNGGWSTLGAGANFPVFALHSRGSILYAGGQFTTVGGIVSQGVAALDTTLPGNAGWRGFGFGVLGTVYALHAAGDTLYVGGTFSHAGELPANHIAAYDITQTGNAGWSALGNGVDDRVWALASVEDILYVGGRFTNAGTNSASRIATFNTTLTGNQGWSTLGSGTNGSVFSFSFIDGLLYVAGGFSEAGGAPSDKIAIYDTAKSGNLGWSTLDGGIDGSVFALGFVDQDLYFGGSFDQIDGRSSKNIGVADLTLPIDYRWSGLAGGIDGEIFALAVVDNSLYVGGRFSQVGEIPANGIAVYDFIEEDNPTWSALGDGVSGIVLSMTAIGNTLYVGGAFAFAGGLTANSVAAYDTTQSGNTGWSTLGDGVNGLVRASAAVDGILFVAGDFLEAGGIPSNRIAAFDTSVDGNDGWSTLGDGINGQSVNALQAIGDQLYVAGTFFGVGDENANFIAAYDTALTGNDGWYSLGDGLFGQAFALTAIADSLFVGGEFLQAGDGFLARNIVEYDTRQSGNAGWSPLGDGVGNRSVYSLTSIGDTLYVGGDFSSAPAGIASADRIAAYNTSIAGNEGWSSLGEGLNDRPEALIGLGDQLYVGGEFSIAGGKANGFLARYDTGEVFSDGFEATAP